MTDRVRVLYLLHSGALDGGAQVQYLYPIDGLDRSRFDPLVVAPTAGDLIDRLTHAGVRTWVSPYPVGTRAALLRWRHRFWRERRRARARLVAFARTLAPHLVHGDATVAPYVTAIAAALGIPSVVHVREAIGGSWPGRRAVTQATRLITIGDRYRDALLASGIPAEHITVIDDATDVERFRPRDKAILREEDRSIDTDDVLFGIVGRIEPFKRQFDFVRAASRMTSSSDTHARRARFFIIGAPHPRRPWRLPALRAFVRAHGLDRSVTITGPRGDMEQAIASLDVLVTLSGGSVMLEAMACGVPVITATDRRPDELRMVRDGECGRVVPAHDIDGLAAVMAELRDDDTQRRRLGAAGRQRAGALFACSRMIDATMRVYDQLLNAPL